MTSEEEFFSSIQPAVDMLMRHAEEGKALRILTHSDADGIAAGAILSLTARRLGLSRRTLHRKIKEYGITGSD